MSIQSTLPMGLFIDDILVEVELSANARNLEVLDCIISRLNTIDKFPSKCSYCNLKFIYVKLKLKLHWQKKKFILLELEDKEQNTMGKYKMGKLIAETISKIKTASSTFRNKPCFCNGTTYRNLEQMEKFRRRIYEIDMPNVVEVKTCQ